MLEASGVCGAISAELCGFDASRRKAPRREWHRRLRGASVTYAVMRWPAGAVKGRMARSDNAIIFEQGGGGRTEDKWFAALGGTSRRSSTRRCVTYCKGGLRRVKRNGVRAKRNGSRRSTHGCANPAQGLQCRIFSTLTRPRQPCLPRKLGYAYSRAHKLDGIQNC